MQAAWRDGSFSGGLAADLLARAHAMPDAEAFRFHSDAALRDASVAPDRLTWRELLARVRDVAGALQQAGIGRGDRVILAHGPGLEFVAAFLGCVWLGAVAVPVSPPRARDRLDRSAHVITDADAAAVMCSAHLQGAFGALRCITVDPGQGGPDAAPVGPDDLAFLQYTSGSTSAPKGVMVTHGMLMTNLDQIRQGFGFGPDDRIVGWLPHYHDMGLIGGILTPVHLGIPIAMISPAAFLRDPLRYLELAGEFRATVLGGPNFGFEHCLRHASPEALARIDLRTLRFAFSGAEPIRPDTLRRFTEVFAPCGFRWRHWAGCYGMAEATLAISIVPPGDGQRLTNAGDTGFADSGVPLPGIEIAIMRDGQQMPPDEIGEIRVRGPNIATRYWRGAPVVDAQGWLHTGDLGVMRDGRLFVTGRAKELIVIRGQNHYPQDIEASIAATHPAIISGRVAAWQVDGAVGIAAEIDRHACRDLQPAPILSAIRAALATGHDLAAGRIALLRPGSLPVTPSGKIQRFACAGVEALAEWRPGDEAPVVVQPAGALARTLRAVPVPLRRGRLLAHLREALARAVGDPSQIADDRRFFDLGLDSVSGVELVTGLERALGLTLDPTLIYEYPTPAALADHLLDRVFAAPAAYPLTAQERP